MVFGIFVLAFLALVGYFALVGIKVTIENRHDSKGIPLIKDLFKYTALMIAVIITCLGLAGLLTLVIDNVANTSADKMDAARWLSNVFIGIPVIAILYRWIRRDFTKNLDLSFQLAWQLYLMVASSVTFFIFYFSSIEAFKWFIDRSYHPSELSRAVITLIVLLLHLRLLSLHNSLISNIHRFIGWASGAIGIIWAFIGMVEFVVAKTFNLQTFDIFESVVLLTISVPITIYYWQDFDLNSSELESRLYRTFAGLALPILFATITTTFTLMQLLTYLLNNRLDREAFFESPKQIGAIVILIPTIIFFRRLIVKYERDEITRAFQYLITSGAVLAIAVGLGAVIAGLLDSTDTEAIYFGSAALITSGPIWIYMWRQCQFAIAIDFEGEHHSPSRSLFLLAAVGIPTIACIGSATIFSYSLFKNFLTGNFDRIEAATPTAILISAGLVAIYHANVMKKERD